MTLSTSVGRAAPEPGASGSTRPAARTFRPDIEGLRAVAVGLVVAFHAGVPWITGGYVGVDVFFVLSGFLITGMLIDEVVRTGTVSIRTFYARRVRRLLPLSALVLVATAAVAIFTVAPLSQADVAGDVRAAALYAANWHFAAGLTDYMAVGVDKSPVLHYWSLAVEEQFYVVWPLVILLLTRVGRGRSAPIGLPSEEARTVRRIGTAIGVIFVVSLVLSMTTSEASGPWAYYGLHTRAWELAAGGALAVARPLLPRLVRPVREVAGWTGLALIVLGALAFTAATTFPGVAAAVPVAGTALLVSAGAGESPVTASRLVSNRLFRYIGRVSYAWYLWHWPCLVLLGALPQTSPAPGHLRVVVVLSLSFLLAAASHRYVEDPVRRSRWLSAVRARSLALGVLLTVVSVVSAIGLQAVSNHSQQVAVAAGGLTMSPAKARDDKVSGLDGCHVGFGVTSAKPANECLFGDPHGQRTVVLIGDSHAQHWFPALNRLAKSKGWRLYEWSKDSCAVNDTDLYLDVYDRAYPECGAWRTSVQQRLSTLRNVDHLIVARSWKYSDYLMKGGQRIKGDAAVSATWRAGAAQTFDRLTRISPDVLVLRDGPRAGSNIPTCLSSHPRDPHACGFERSGHTHLDNVLTTAEREAAKHRSGVRFADPTDLICGKADRCPAVAPSGVVIYRDDSHMTQTYSRSLAPRLADAFRLD